MRNETTGNVRFVGSFKKYERVSTGPGISPATKARARRIVFVLIAIALE
jgi:hypothetical protein